MYHEIEREEYIESLIDRGLDVAKKVVKPRLDVYGLHNRVKMVLRGYLADDIYSTEGRMSLKMRYRTLAEAALSVIPRDWYQRSTYNGYGSNELEDIYNSNIVPTERMQGYVIDIIVDEMLFALEPMFLGLADDRGEGDDWLDVWRATTLYDDNEIDGSDLRPGPLSVALYYDLISQLVDTADDTSSVYGDITHDVQKTLARAIVGLVYDKAAAIQDWWLMEVEGRVMKDQIERLMKVIEGGEQ